CFPPISGEPRPWWLGITRVASRRSRREGTEVWHKVRSSGSTTQRVMASSRSRAARTSSSTTVPSRPRASRAWPRGTKSSSRSPRARKGFRRRTSARLSDHNATHDGPPEIPAGRFAFPPVVGKKKPRRYLRHFVLQSRPAGEGRDRRGRWFLDPPGPPACYGALGGDHLTDHRRGTHRLDHLPFSARPDSRPRCPLPRTGRRLPAGGSITSSPAKLPTGDARESLCALRSILSASYPLADRRAKAFLLHRDATLVPLDDALADSLHLLEILHTAERPVRLPVLDDAIRRARPDPAQLHQLGPGRLVDVDLAVGLRRLRAAVLARLLVGRRGPRD